MAVIRLLRSTDLLFLLSCPPFRHVRNQVWRGAKDGVVIVAALLYPPPKEVKLTKGRNGGAPRVASERFLGVLAYFMSAPPTASLRIWAWCEPITLINE